MPRLFGTNGVRGVVGDDMGPALAMDLGRALGTWLQEACDWWDAPSQGRPAVLIGSDHRTSNRMLVSAVSAGLLSTGCDVHDAGMAPTPAIQLAVREDPKVAAGVIITASHNPPEFNGIKLCRGDGREMEPPTEEAIEAFYFGRTFRQAPWDGQGEIHATADLVPPYHAAVCAQVDADAIRAAKLHIVVDPANGAGCMSLPFLLGDLGCRVVSLNAQLDGTFPGHPSEPTPDNAGDLQALVKRTGAQLGILLDGDADRAIFIDEQGSYVPGDKSLALLAGDAVARAGGGIVCTPVSSSSIVEELVEAKGGTVHYTVVGSPKVASAMHAQGAVFGGEENGGLIFPRHQFTRDAAMSALAMIDLMVRSGRPLSELVQEVPNKAVIKLKTKVPDPRKQAALATIKARVQAGDLPAGIEVRNIDDRDGVKINLVGGWVLVRASGTEPIMRVYAEADDEPTAKVWADTFLSLLEEAVAAAV